MIFYGYFYGSRQVQGAAHSSGASENENDSLTQQTETENTLKPIAQKLKTTCLAQRNLISAKKIAMQKQGELEKTEPQTSFIVKLSRNLNYIFTWQGL